jgi:hypothetical protein
MKISIVIFLSCVSALAEDPGVRLVSTVTTTNSLGIYTTETFTRGGQTNLVRMTGVKDGTIVYASHSFFHCGNLVATSIGTPNPTSFHTRDGLPYQVSLEFWPSRDVRGLHINGKDFNEMFHATNGVFYPAPDSELGVKDHIK